MNVIVLVMLIALAIGVVVAWRAGVRHGQHAARAAAPPLHDPPRALPPAPALPRAVPPVDATRADIGAEKARIIVGLEMQLARAATAAEDRAGLAHELADARAEAARYRQLLIDLENNAPPPLLDRPGSPDDLKLIVGIGPVLERMLQQLGVSTYKQIARWSERDIDEFDARLAEFPGRIRRDGWVTQARALHQSKYGESLPAR